MLRTLADGLNLDTDDQALLDAKSDWKYERALLLGKSETSSSEESQTSEDEPRFHKEEPLRPDRAAEEAGRDRRGKKTTLRTRLLVTGDRKKNKRPIRNQGENMKRPGWIANHLQR